MTSEPTLGDILGAVLASVQADPEAGQRQLERGRYEAALTLSDQLAPMFVVTFGEVFDALCTFPDHMLRLLETPEGWTTLAGYIATDFGVPIVTYKPTIH